MRITPFPMYVSTLFPNIQSHNYGWAEGNAISPFHNYIAMGDNQEKGKKMQLDVEVSPPANSVSPRLTLNQRNHVTLT